MPYFCVMSEYLLIEKKIRDMIIYNSFGFEPD